MGSYIEGALHENHRLEDEKRGEGQPIIPPDLREKPRRPVSSNVVLLS